MTNAGHDLGPIGFDLHAAAAPVSLLAPPQFSIDRGRGDRHSGRQPGQRRDEAFAVRFSRRLESKHVEPGHPTHGRTFILTKPSAPSKLERIAARPCKRSAARPSNRPAARPRSLPPLSSSLNSFRSFVVTSIRMAGRAIPKVWTKTSLTGSA